MSSRNRAAGLSFENQIKRALRHVFPKVKTARKAARGADDAGMDLIETGRYGFQCKKSGNTPNIMKYFDRIPDDKVPIIVHQRTKRARINMVPVGPVVAILPFEDLIELLEKAELLTDQNS